jgi:hypothetical protein
LGVSLSIVGGTSGDGTSIVPNVELVGKMVESGAEVVVGIADDQGPRGVQRLDLADAKAIFQSITLTLERDGPVLAIYAPVEVEFEYSVVLDCPLQLRYGAIEAPAHKYSPYAATWDGAS